MSVLTDENTGQRYRLNLAENKKHAAPSASNFEKWTVDWNTVLGYSDALEFKLRELASESKLREERERLAEVEADLAGVRWLAGRGRASLDDQQQPCRPPRRYPGNEALTP